MEQQGVLEYVIKGMHAALEHLRQELRALRAGRAHAACVEDVHVDVYGSQLRLKELATITSPEPRQLLVTPFDINNGGLIMKALEKANLGVRVAMEGKLVRIFFPELDAARRKDLAKQVHEKKERCKASIRTVRQEANKKVKELKTAGVAEDDLKRLEKDIQVHTDAACKDADDCAMVKEKEVMTI